MFYTRIKGTSDSLIDINLNDNPELLKKSVKLLSQIQTAHIPQINKLDDESLPYKDKDYFYWNKTTIQGNYSIKLKLSIQAEISLTVFL